MANRPLRNSATDHQPRWSHFHADRNPVTTASAGYRFPTAQDDDRFSPTCEPGPSESAAVVQQTSSGTWPESEPSHIRTQNFRLLEAEYPRAESLPPDKMRTRPTFLHRNSHENLPPAPCILDTTAGTGWHSNDSRSGAFISFRASTTQGS
jgi:hypothetical protein